MKIHILGTRGEIKTSASKYERHSGILIDNKLMVDIGEPEYLKYKPEYLLITHLHPDHAYFVRENEKIDLTFWGPEKYLNSSNSRIINDKTKFGDYTITPVPTFHAKRAKSQGYVIEKDNKTIFYSGDMLWIKKDDQKLLPQQLELVITDGSYINKGGRIIRDKEGNLFGHTGIPDLFKLFSNFTKEIALVHYGSWFYGDIEQSKIKIKSIANEFKLNAIISEDDEVIEA